MTSPHISNDPAQNEEWRRQERARRAERRASAAGDPDHDRSLASYRLIDRALRDSPDALPENFASQTAALVESAPRGVMSDRLESWLQRALVVALILAATAALCWTDDRVLAGLASARGAEWIYAVALCVGLSQALQHFAQRRMKKR